MSGCARAYPSFISISNPDGCRSRQDRIFNSVRCASPSFFIKSSASCILDLEFCLYLCVLTPLSRRTSVVCLTAPRRQHHFHQVQRWTMRKPYARYRRGIVPISGVITVVLGRPPEANRKGVHRQRTCRWNSRRVGFSIFPFGAAGRHRVVRGKGFQTLLLVDMATTRNFRFYWKPHSLVDLIAKLMGQ